MIRGLHRRLSLTFGLLSGLVLVGMLAITCVLARSQYQLSQEVLFQSQFQTLIREVQLRSNISSSSLAQIARDESAFFYIEIDGIPLHYSAMTVRDPDRAELLDALRQQAQTLGFDAAFHDSLTFTAELRGSTYRATAFSDDHYLLFYSQDISAQLLHLRNLTLTYILLGALGLLALMAVSAFLARLAARPTVRMLREQQDFIAAAGHELRSPLTVIRASLFDLRQRVAQPDLAAHAELADQEAERMGRLIGDLLTLAGSGGGHWSLELRPTELDTVCVRLYEQFLPQARQSRHPLQLLLPEAPLPVVPTDEHRLIQLLSVLLSNALDHTPEGTPVTLAVGVSGRWVRFSVADRGPGIPDGEKKAVFQRFYRSDQSRTDKQHFGLGLAIAAELADVLGGHLALSDTPGGGATFTLRLYVSRGTA